MLGLNCLLKDPGIVRDLGLFMQYEALYTLPLRGQSPSLMNLYNHLRKEGIEVDLQSAATIYANTFDLKDKQYTSRQDVEQASGRTLQRIVDKKAASLRSGEIGKDSPVVAAIRHLASLVQPDQQQPSSVQKVFEERLQKFLRTQVDLPNRQTNRQSTFELLKEALSTEERNKFSVDQQSVSGYMQNARTLWAEFQKEVDAHASDMEDHDAYGAEEFRAYADQIQKASYNLFLSNREVGQVLQEVIREAGFTRVLTIGGKEQLATDWKKVMNTHFDLRSTLTQVFGRKGFSTEETTRLVDYFEHQFNELRDQKISEAMEKTTSSKSRTDIERLAALSRLGVFQQSEKKLIYDVLGVNHLTQAQMQDVDGMLQTLNQAMRDHPEARYSPTFVETINRHIRNLSEQAQEGQHFWLGAVRKLSMYMQWSASALLVNNGNMTENFSSGFGEMINTAMTNPRLLPQMISTFGRTFVDVLKGGVREGHNTSNLYEQKANVEDRTSNEVLKSSTAKVAYGIFNGLQRASLSAMDAAYKASIWKSVESTAFQSYLKGKGLTATEARLVMNETYFGNRAHIEQTAHQLENMLVASGINSAKGKWRRIAGQIAVANLASDGQFFQDTLRQLEAAGKLKAGTADQVTFDKDFIDAIRDRSYNVAGRGVGHIQDLMATSFIDRAIRRSNENADKARKSGNYGKMASLEASQALTYGFFKFRSGALRWMMLNLYKSSPVPLLTTLVVDMARNKQHRLLGSTQLVEAWNQVQGTKAQGTDAYNDALGAFSTQFEQAYAVRQRLARSVVQPFMSYILFKTVLGPAFEKLMSFVCHDSSEGCLQKKMLLLKQNGWDAFVTKMVPIYYQNYLYSLIRDDGYGHVKPVDKKEAAGSAEEFYASPKYWMPNLEQLVAHNFGNDPVYEPASRVMKDALAGNADKVDVDLGSFVGKALNLAGPLKLYDIDRRYSNSFHGMLSDHYDPSYSNKMGKNERKKTAADGVIEAILKEQLTQDMFDVWIKGQKK